MKITLLIKSAELGCIFFANRGFDWPEADRYCQDNSSALIEIYSQAHMDFIRSELFVLENFIGDHVWWTGGSDVGRKDISSYHLSISHRRLGKVVPSFSTALFQPMR